MRKRPWTEADKNTLAHLYPDTPTKQIAELLGRTMSQVYQAADRLGLKKSPAYMASPDACRLRRGDNVGAAHRFTKGHAPANKGLRRPGWAPGRMRETQFKKGERRGVAARNYCPVGTIRPDAEGYLRIKVREPLPGEKVFGFGNPGIWPLLNRHVWEQTNGPIPDGHNVIFKDRNRSNCALDNLELVSRAEMMRRNTIHRYPEQLRNTIMLLGAVKRKVREHAEKHDDGSAQPPVRGDGGAQGRRETDGHRTGESSS